MLLPAPINQNWIPATDLFVREVRQGWGSLHIGQSVQGRQLRVVDKPFQWGLGTHADSSMSFYLAGRYSRFRSWVGIDAEVAAYDRASVDFQVFLDGRKVFDSGVMKVTDPAQKIDLDVSHATEMRLVVTDAGDGNYADHADWGDAQLLPAAPTRRIVPSSWKGPLMRAQGLRVRWENREGTLVATLDGREYRINTDIDGARPMGRATTRQGPQGEWILIRDLSCEGGHRVRASQRLRREGDSIGWTVSFEGLDSPWSAPIDTTMSGPQSSLLWMAAGRGSTWEDPLSFWLPKHEFMAYGKRFDRANGISLPLATLWPKGANHALLLAMSPRDPLLGLDLMTKPGLVQFSRTMHRIQKGRPVVFHMNLAPVASDCRSSLGWMARKYREYFEPPNPDAGKIAGLGAYSGYEGALEVAKFKTMGFKTNWKASIDFPYMGMFLPPVSPEERWNRFAGGGGGQYGPKDEGRFGTTSLNQLEAYNRQMKQAGFAVLNYFNVTEFGGNIVYPAPELKRPPDWRDPSSFLYGKIPNAILRDPNPLWTWGGAIVTDCGDPTYRDFLLDQAKRHLTFLKSGAGICIDRTDWLERVNPHADDGLTWSHGPVRSLLNSWRGLMARLGPMMHKAGKVIFVNDLIRRLDIMREADGVYDEFGFDGGDLNGTAFLCLLKPQIAWTANEDQLKPDPDAFMQRHLYMGAFPTAPMQGNDHCILPSPWADSQYLAYGRLFTALQERKWVLEPWMVRAKGAKVNLFSVPTGYVIPIMFAGHRRAVELQLSERLKGWRLESIRPGEKTWVRVARRGNSVVVPIARGCAMLRIRN